MSQKWDQMINNNEGIIRKDKMILCIPCNYQMDKRLSQKLKQHLGSTIHLDNSQLYQDHIKPDIFVIKEEFYKDLVKMLITCGISFKSADKKDFREFFHKYMGKNLPCSSLLRQNYMEKVYQDQVSKLKEKINGNKIYIMLDETQINKYVQN